jgi:hypothetical protein
MTVIDATLYPFIRDEAMQAALAAALPALVQQVERLTQELDRMRWHASDGNAELDRLRTERDTLSAANARLAKDAERWCELVPRFKGITSYGKPRAYFIQLEITGHEPIVPLPDLVDWLIAHKSDAATAQAKQAEGGVRQVEGRHLVCQHS